MSTISDVYCATSGLESLFNRKQNWCCTATHNSPTFNSFFMLEFFSLSPVSLVWESNVNSQHVRFSRWDNYESEEENNVARIVSELKCEEGHYRLMCINFCSGRGENKFYCSSMFNVLGDLILGRRKISNFHEMMIQWGCSWEFQHNMSTWCVAESC